MSWIKSYDTLRQHPKTLRLARLLGVNVRETIGLLHCLWWWCMDYAPDGDLSRYDPDEIAAAVDWPNGEQLVGALQSSGFLDCMQLHDWCDYGGKLYSTRSADSERVRQHRAGKEDTPDETTESEDVRRTSAGHNADVRRTYGVRNADVRRTSAPREDKIREDKNTEEESTPESMSASQKQPESDPPDIPDIPEQSDPSDPSEPSEPPDPQDPPEHLRPPGNSDVQAAFEAYRTAIQPRARLLPAARDKIKRRLATYSLAELEQAVAHFAADAWQMEHNAHRGAAWFFHSDERIEQFINLVPRASTGKDTGNGRHPNQSEPAESAGEPAFSALSRRLD